MNGKWAIDTNAYIDARRGIPAVTQLLDAAEEVYLPAPVMGEILYGAMNSGQSQKNIEAANQFISQCILLPVDAAVAVRYAGLRCRLKSLGKPIPENDLWIAAICEENDLPLLSRDRHFCEVAGLRVQDW